MGDLEKNVQIYNLSNYTFGVKDPQKEKGASVQARMARMKEVYEAEGMRTSAEGVMLVHRYGHPHVLLMQIGTYFKLPGGKLRPGENDKSGLLRKLQTKLGPSSSSLPCPDWQVDELLCNWWRPNFETNMYPYNPPHITKPKECKKLFLVKLPDRCAFAVPKNFELLAVPLFELYDNSQRYGPIISSIPQLLGHLNFIALN